MLRNKSIFVFLAFVFILSATVIAYSSSLSAPFYLDDQASIENNAFVKDNFSFQNLTGAYPFRQLTYASFAMNYSLLDGTVESFHWVNIILHCLAGLSLFLFSQKLLFHTGIKQHSVKVALIIAAVFLLAPINSQSVIYTVQRGTIFVALFYLLGLYCFLRLRKDQDIKIIKGLLFVILCGCFIFGMLSKQNFVTFPIACLLLEIFVIKRLSSKLVSALIPVSIFALMFIHVIDFLMGLQIFERINDTLLLTTVYSRWEYFTHQLVLIWVYSYKFFYPAPLLLEYSLTAYSWQDSIVWLAFIGHVLIIFTAFHFRRRFPWLIFAVLLFYLTHSLESSLLAVLPDLGFEHRAYLPNVTLAILTGVLIAFLWGKKIYLGVGALLIQLTVGFILIQQRGDLWNNREAFYRHELKHTADNPRPYAMVSQLFARDNRIRMATKWMQLAIQVGLEAGQLQGTLISQYMEILYVQGRVGEANSIAVKVLNIKTNNNTKAEVLKTMARNKVKNHGCELAMGLIKRGLRFSSKDYELRLLQERCNEQLRKPEKSP